MVETFSAWHLTKTQAEFATLVLDHFHKSINGQRPKQLLALCLGAPGTGKSQTMLAIIWHMSQHRPPGVLRNEIATCAFMGGAAMLICTLHTTPMTTCRQFQINLRGPNLTPHSIHILTDRIENLLYVFIDEFSFLSYRHLKDIVEQLGVGLGQWAQKDKPFAGMNFVFFGDYEQLSKPGDYAMYYGAAAEENSDAHDMKTWLANEMEQQLNNASYEPMTTFTGRDLWTSIDMVRTLTVQKRQIATEDGQHLIARCTALRAEKFPDEFFDSIQEKAVQKEQLISEEWSTPLYIVMRHDLRVPTDFNEAKFQVHRQSKRFIQWATVDTIMGKTLPPSLQLILDTIIIDKIPRFQYFYEGMPIAFVDNKYFAAGNATNNLGYAISITLDPCKPPDDLAKPN